MSDNAVFKVSARNYVAIEHQNYKSQLASLRINNVLVYNQYRAQALEVLQSRTLDVLYDLIFTAMTVGRVDGRALFGDLQPKVPDHLASQTALQIGKQVCDLILTKVVDAIIPENHGPAIYANPGVTGTEANPQV